MDEVGIHELVKGKRISYATQHQEKIQNKTPHLKVPDIYTPRPPIYINRNENFTEENGVVGGNGTKENPYIIEGWEINASITDGIRIENTTAYFVIRNCYIYKGIENYNYGMVFLNVRNGEVENVILYENGVSIRYSSDFAFVGNNISYGFVVLYEANNCSIIGNEINNLDGIHLINSANISVSNNILNNNYAGIWFYHSSNCIVTQNYLYNNKKGIMLYKSINCTLTNNTMINNGIVLGGDSLKYWNTHEIDVTNTVNGKPVYYWKNIKGGIVPSGVGQVILANCSNVIIKNQNISNATVGIEIGFSNNCNIVNSILTKSVIGIELHNSTSCIIDECILNNNNISILLLNGKNCKIINSNILYSNITGILTLDSDANNISNCNISHNFQGIEINRASNNYVGYNIFYNNSEALLMESTWYDEIIKNTFCKNTKGISMSWACFANISRNNFSNNDIAIFIYDSFNNSIFKNEIVSNNYGILIKISTFNKIKYNCICENQIGINMTNTKNNEINYNNIFGNSKYGIKGGELS